VMKRQKYGKITNISSSTIFKGTPNMLHYVASKGAVLSMTRSLARELGDFGICVNALAAGLTLSEMVKGNSEYEFARNLNVTGRCLKREQEPVDLVGTVIFLSSPDSDFMTGQTLLVDGGSAMH